MAIFPSQAWCDVLKDTLNRSADFAKNAKDYVGDSIWLITPEGSLTKTVRLYVSYDHGHVPELYVMAESEMREAEVTVTGSLSTFRKVVEGKLNPAPALARGQIKIEGMSMKVVRNIKALQSLFENMIQVPSEFPI